MQPPNSPITTTQAIHTYVHTIIASYAHVFITIHISIMAEDSSKASYNYFQ